MQQILRKVLLFSVFFTYVQWVCATDYFWVGGKGHWNDANHWSLLSGGNGGAGVPGIHDDVFFDNQSFISSRDYVAIAQSVSIRSFNYSNTLYRPKFISNGEITFTVNGDWLVSGTFRNYIRGEIHFNSNNLSVLNSGQVHFRSHLKKTGTGTLSLQGSGLNLEPGNRIIFESGIFTSNGFDIVTDEFSIIGNSNKTLQLSSSTIATESPIDFNHPGLQSFYTNTEFLQLIPVTQSQNIFERGVSTCGVVPNQFTITTFVNSNYNGQNISCNGQCDGEVCVSIVGGIGPFAIQWLSGGPATACYSNLCPGTYTVRVTDLGQGVLCAASIQVTEPDEVTVIDWAQTNPSCNGVCDGTATPILTFGGVQPYTYLWGTGESTTTAVQLCVGANTLTVTDNNGCTFDTTFFILTPTPLVVNGAITPASCFGVCDGVATANPTGGNGAPFTLLWSTGGVTNSINGLCAGTYTLHIEDNNNCPKDTIITITEPIALSIVLTNQTNLICNNVCSGSLTVSSSNGTFPHTYQWFSSPGNIPLAGQTNATANGLCAGSYYVIVTDANGCSQQSAVFTLTQPTAINFSTTPTPATCNGLCNGVLTITSGGGTPPHTYNWINAATGTIIGSGSPLNGVCPGTYFAEITDGNGCIVNSIPPITVLDPPPLAMTINPVNAVCNNDCNGSAIANPVSGGTGTLTVTWFDAVPTQIGLGLNISLLCDGNYSATVTDVNGCTLDVPFTINEPASYDYDLTTTSVGCIGSCNGTATLSNITGESGVYSVSWSSSANTGLTEPNLCAGNYTVTIVDQFGCDTIIPFTIGNPIPLTLDPGFMNPTCSGICNGTAWAEPSGGTGTYTYVWTDLGTGLPLGQVTDTVTSLCPGNYQVVVFDQNGCSANTNYTLVNPGGMSGTIVTTTSSCGICDGTATVTVVGGTPGFSFVWMNATTGNPIGQSSNPALNLCAGSYYVIITDANGCSVLSDTVPVTDNVIITASATATPPSCFGFCNGSINLTVLGGTAPFTFQWFDQATGNPIGQSVEDPVGLCAGNYFVQIFDVNGCTPGPVSVTLTQPTLLTANASGIDAICFGVCNGQGTINVNGGSPPYSFAWVNTTSGATVAVAQNPNNLCAGNYDVTITDNGGCSVGPINITINQPPAMILSVNETDATCFNVCNGSAIASIIGGNAPYSYVWSSSGNTTANENGLCDGNYTVSATDNSGCPVGPINFTIEEPTPLTVNTTDGVLLCAGVCNGSVSVNVNGGTGPYTYQWDAAAGSQTTPVAVGLCVGNYTVVVTDANGCIIGPLAVQVTGPTPITGVTSFTGASCNGVCDGTATTTFAGGTPPYQFSWNDPLNQNTSTAISLCAGTYTVTITDANGCTFNPPSVTVTAPGLLSLNTSSTDAICNAACNGTGTVVINGGSGPFTTNWNDPLNQTSLTAVGLCAGTYSVSVIDNNGCSGNASVTINEPSAITSNTSFTPSTCNVCDGTATINGFGGTGTLDIQWDANAGSQVTATATALCAGIYDVTLTDDNGCSVVETVAVSDLNGEALTVDSTNVVCFGDCNGSVTVNFNCSDPACTILWNDPANSTINTVNNLCAGTYGVTVTNNSGCISSATVTVGTPQLLVANASQTNVLCFGTCTGTGTVAPTGGTPPYSIQWDASAANQTTTTAFNFCLGNYSVVVTDAAGCTANANLAITQPTALTSVVNSSNATCNNLCNGSGTAFPSGGTAPYSFIWDDPASQSTQMATSLCAGSYNVTVLDANGCTFGPSAILITEPAPLSFVMSSTPVDCFGDCDGTATATVIGGVSPYFYQWNVATGNQITSTATNLCAGIYDVTITDVNGCPAGNGSAVIAEPNQITGSFTANSPTCTNDCDGTIISTLNGGTLSYTLQWNDPANTTSANVFNLCPGTYELDLTDANGCQASFTTTINITPAILGNITATNITCNGSCNGTINTNPSGGLAPYTFNWSNGATTQNVSGLCPGLYSVIITDANGCSVVFNRNITEPTPITFTTGNSFSTCGICNGSVSISPSGGTPGYTYQWSPVAGNQTSQTAINLCAGVYNVVVTDAAGCQISTSVGLSDIGAENLVATSTDASCFDVCDGTATGVTACINAPCAFSWFFSPSGLPIGQSTATATALCAGDYLVQVTNNSSCVSVALVTVNEPTEILSNTLGTDVLCNGDCNGVATVNPSGGSGVYTFLWDAAAGNSTNSTVNGLCAGSYVVQITDNTSCSITDTIVINSPQQLQVAINTMDALCNGDCNGVATASVNGGTAPYLFLWSDPLSQITISATGLCDGNINVQVTDANGCIANAASVINEPLPLSAALNGVDALCNNDCNGTATVVPSGGTAPYTFLWNDPAAQTNSTATGLCAGTYNVQVIDQNNCVISPPASFTVNNPSPITFSSTSVDNLCNGFCNGSITITASGGTGSFLYSINNGTSFQVSNVFSNLCAGSYTVVVQDGNLCLSNAQNVNINEPSDITATTSEFAATCLQADGAASVFPSGGTPNYTFNWFNSLLVSIGQTTQTAINLAAGIYVVEVTDAAGCTEQFSVTVSNINAPTLSGVTSDANCNGSCNGSIDVTANGGTAPYGYLWIPNGQTTEDVSNLCAGGYLVSVTDALGCVNFANFTISQPAAFSANFTLTDATCGLCDGTASVVINGGTNPYTLDWSNGQTGANASGLCSGAYMVQVIDANGCQQTFNTGINNIGGPTGEVLVINHASCGGVCDGDATVTPVGGTAPYSFYWIHDGSTNNTASALCAGTYFVEVTDTNGCIRVTNVIINQPAQISDSTIITPATCGLCDGVLSVFPSGGTLPYTFQWDANAGNATTSIVTSLCEQVYSLIVTDGNGCKDTIINTINGATAPQLLVNNSSATCQGVCDATATVNINFGLGPFTTTWLDGFGVTIGQSGTNATGLCAGNYIVQVVDAAGCTAFSQFTINEPDSLLFSLPFVLSPGCFNSCDGLAVAIVIEGSLPYQFSWNDPSSQTTAQASSLCSGNYVVTVTDGNGCSTQQNVTVPAPDSILVSFIPVDASCSTVNDGSIDATVSGGAGGFTFSWTGPNNFVANTEDLNSIFPGTYSLTVTDANGCTFTDSVVVGAILVVDANAGNDTTTCSGGSGVVLTGSGGVTYEWFDLAGTSLGTGSNLTVNPIGGVQSYVLVANNNGCIDRDTVQVTVNTLPTVNAGPDRDILVGQSTSIGGNPTTSGNNTVVWTPNTDLNNPLAFNPTASPSVTTTYVVEVTDPNGCRITDTMIVNVFPNITFPNGFSPNGDGTNDVWVIDLISLFPEAQVEVYNRWGQLLFLSIGYLVPWDGTYNNQPVPVGTYYYIINLNHPLYPDAFTGPLTVIR